MLKLKRMLSFVLAISMIFSLVVPAYAEDVESEVDEEKIIEIVESIDDEEITTDPEEEDLWEEEQNEVQTEVQAEAPSAQYGAKGMQTFALAEPYADDVVHIYGSSNSMTASALKTELGITATYIRINGGSRLSNSSSVSLENGVTYTVETSSYGYTWTAFGSFVFHFAPVPAMTLKNAEFAYYSGMANGPTAQSIQRAVFQGSDPADIPEDMLVFQYMNGNSWSALEDSAVTGATLTVRMHFAGGELNEVVYAEGDSPEATVTFYDPRTAVEVNLKSPLEYHYYAGMEVSAASVFDAIVESNDVLTADNVTVSYETETAYNRTGYVELGKSSGYNYSHAFGARDTEQVQIVYAGDNTYQSKTITATLNIIRDDEISIQAKAGTVTYYTGIAKNPTADDIFNAVFDAASSTSDITRDMVVVQYTSNNYTWNAVNDAVILNAATGNNKYLNVRLHFNSNTINGMTYLAADSASVRVTFADTRADSAVAVSSGKTITFVPGGEVPTAEEIFNLVYSAEGSTLNENYASGLFTVLYNGKPYDASIWNGWTANTLSIQIQFKGNGAYKPSTSDPVDIGVTIQESRQESNIVAKSTRELHYWANKTVTELELVQTVVDLQSSTPALVVAGELREKVSVPYDPGSYTNGSTVTVTVSLINDSEYKDFTLTTDVTIIRDDITSITIPEEDRQIEIPYNHHSSGTKPTVEDVKEKLISAATIKPTEIQNSIIVQYERTYWAGLFQRTEWTTLTQDALNDNLDSSLKVRLYYVGGQIGDEGMTYLASQSEDVTVTFPDTRAEAPLALKGDQTVDMIFKDDGSKDYAALKEAIFAEVYDAENSIALTADDVTITYLRNNNYIALNYNNYEIDSGAGDPLVRTVKVTFGGNEKYKATEETVDITLNKDTRADSVITENEALEFHMDSDTVVTDEAVFNAIVESCDPVLMDKDGKLLPGVTVAFATSSNNYQPLTYQPGWGHKFGENETESVRISFAGNATHKAATRTVDLTIIHDNASTIAVKDSAVTVDYYAVLGNPTPKNVIEAIFDADGSVPKGLTADKLKIQYELIGWPGLDQNVINTAIAWNTTLKVKLVFAGGVIGEGEDAKLYRAGESKEVTVSFRDISEESKVALQENPTLDYYPGMASIPTANDIFLCVFDSTNSTPNGMLYSDAGKFAFQYKDAGNRWQNVTDGTLNGWTDKTITVQIQFKGGTVGEKTYAPSEFAEAVVTLNDTRDALTILAQNGSLEYNAFMADKPNEASILDKIYNGATDLNDLFSVEYKTGDDWVAYDDNIWANESVSVRIKFAGGTFGEGDYKESYSESVVLTLEDKRAELVIEENDASLRVYYLEESAPTVEDLLPLVMQSIHPASWNEETTDEEKAEFTDPTNLTVLYKSGDSFKELDDGFTKEPVELVELQVVFAGNAEYKGCTLDTGVEVKFGEASHVAVKTGVELNYYTGMTPALTAEDIFHAIFDGDNSNPSDITFEKVVVQRDAGSWGRENWQSLTGNLSTSLLYTGSLKVRLFFMGNEDFASCQSDAVTVTFKDLREDAPITEKAEDEHSLIYRSGTPVEPQAVLDAIAVIAEESGLTVENLTIQYNASNYGSNYVSLNNTTTGHKFGEKETESIRITFPGNETYTNKTITANLHISDGREPSTVVLKENVTISYNSAPAVMEKELFEKLIDWESSSLPEKETLSLEDFTIQYSARFTIAGIETGYGTWAPISGGSVQLGNMEIGIFPQMNAGTHDILINFNGNETHLATSHTAGVSVNVKKSSARLTIRPTAIFAEEDLPENFISSNAAEDLGVITIYTGVTNNVSLGVYADIPFNFDPNNPLVGAADLIIKPLLDVGIQDILKDGITLGQLRQIVGTEDILALLNRFGYDTTVLTQVLNVLDAVSGITDNIRIGIGKPSHVGMYSAFAISTNPNYNTTVGVGILVVKLRLIGMKLTWNETFSGSIKASEVADKDFGALLTYNGDPSVSQSNVKYRYTGLTSRFRLYSSTKAPTEAGSYVVTAYAQGGNQTAVPITRSFRIVNG